MKRISVALVDLGEQLPIPLERLAKRLNALQSAYHYSVEKSIPSIGDPDDSYQWYHVERLIAELQKHHRADNYDYVIGLTHVRITLTEPDAEDTEKDYFSYGDYRRCAVISMNANVLSHLSRSTNKLQYAAFLVTGELLCARARQNLCHTTTEGCLFDDCPDRKNIARSILSGTICIDCLPILKKASIGEQELASVRKVLAWSKRRTGSGSLWARVAQHSLTSLSMGTLIGWLSSFYITAANLRAAILASLLVPCVVGLYYAAKDRSVRASGEE